MEREKQKPKGRENRERERERERVPALCLSRNPFIEVSPGLLFFPVVKSKPPGNACPTFVARAFGWREKQAEPIYGTRGTDRGSKKTESLCVL